MQCPTCDVLLNGELLNSNKVGPVIIECYQGKCYSCRREFTWKRKYILNREYDLQETNH